MHLLPSIKIENITKHLDLLDAIVQWHEQEWGIEWAKQVRISTQENGIPTIYLALDNGEPVGTAMLTDEDMDSRKDLYPWLAGVYIKPSHRGKGIATALVQHVMQEAGRLKIPQLWLYTSNLENLYKKLGWQLIEQEPYLGERVSIMKYEIT